MRKQIHPLWCYSTTLHTNGATTRSFWRTQSSAYPGLRQREAKQGSLALTNTALYEISDVDVFLVKKRGVFHVNENAISRFKKR